MNTDELLQIVPYLFTYFYVAIGIAVSYKYWSATRKHTSFVSAAHSVIFLVGFWPIPYNVVFCQMFNTRSVTEETITFKITAAMLPLWERVWC